MGKRHVKIKKDGEKSSGIVSVFSRSWKILLSVGVALGLIISIISFDARLYKTAQAEQEKKETIKTFEQLQKSIETGQKQIQTDRKKDKLESELRDLRIEQKLLLRREAELGRVIEKSPRDPRFKQDLEDVRRDLDENKRDIEEVKKQLGQFK